MTAGRVAVYFAPDPESPWGEFGRRWLVADRPHTEEPRRYGFHATLKAPFELRAGTSRADLEAAMTAFAAGREAIPVPRLEIARLGGFLALVPSAPEPRLGALAFDCLRAFDTFRDPLGPVELARRRAAKLTPRQDRRLLEWGYPYVIEEYRFHLTLTGPVPVAEQPAVVAAAREAIIDVPLIVDALALFEQPDRSEPFRPSRRFPFGERPK